MPAIPAAEPRVPSPEPRFLDDFAAMEQVVRRRYAAVVEAGGPFPDLLVVDGGKGQLSAAYAALERVGLSNLVAVGLAKKEELVFTRDRDEPIALDRDDPALLLLQRIRDEAHRFAVTFHRKSRTRRDFASELDTIAGVGARRRNQLLRRFGSVAGVRRATREELVPLVGQRRRRRDPRALRTRRRRRLIRAVGRCAHCAALWYADALWRTWISLQIGLSLAVLLVSLTVHEAAHAWAANQLGDPTARIARPADLEPGRPHRPDRHAAVPAAGDHDRLAADRLGQAGAGGLPQPANRPAVISRWSRRRDRSAT